MNLSQIAALDNFETVSTTSYSGRGWENFLKVFQRVVETIDQLLAKGLDEFHRVMIRVG